MENLEKIVWEVMLMPEKVTCSVCGYPTDEDMVGQCPECNSNICDECTELYDGYCQDCFDEVDEDY
jgi:predicted Zn-ribbon and HTH transcriptional regulator